MNPLMLLFLVGRAGAFPAVMAQREVRA